MRDLRAKLKDERRKRIDAETKVSMLEEAIQQILTVAKKEESK